MDSRRELNVAQGAPGRRKDRLVTAAAVGVCLVLVVITLDLLDRIDQRNAAVQHALSLSADAQELVALVRRIESTGTAESVVAPGSYLTLAERVEQVVRSARGELESLDGTGAVRETSVDRLRTDTERFLRSVEGYEPGSVDAVIQDHRTTAQQLSLVVGRAEDSAGRAALLAVLDIVLTLPTVTLLLVMAYRRLTRLRQVTQGLNRFEAMVAGSLDIFVATDRTGSIGYVSRAVTGLLGHSQQSWTGTLLSEHVLRQDESVVAQMLERIIADPGETRTEELHLRHVDGRIRRFETDLHSVANQRLDRHSLIWTLRDVTRRRDVEEQLSHLAFHDPLTGLANRALLRNRLEHSLVRIRRREDRFAVVFVDLDGFKDINDSLGHAAGDEVLCEIASRLRGVVRSVDTLARLGGDEFAILLEEITDEDLARQIAERALEAVCRPLHIRGLEQSLSASMGLVLAEGGESAEALLRDADTAMYEAKSRGKGRVVLFEPVMHTKATDRLELASDLRRAVAEDQLQLLYQPVVDSVTSLITGAEALVRWRHPRLGLLSPDRFIHLAEENGSIVEIGRWVLDTACCQAALWLVRSPRTAPQFVSVNVSPRQLGSVTILRDVASALECSGLEPERLTLEITESVLVDDVTEAETRLRQLKDLGIRLAIDDFGTGYSSLNYLRRFPLDTLKIDRSFFSAAPDRAVLSGILHLGQALGMTTVAEGVETDDHADLLRSIGIDAAQGFLFARPAAPEILEPLFGKVMKTETLTRQIVG